MAYDADPSDDDLDFIDPDQPVVLPIEDWIDLHTFSPKEIKPLVEEYLYQCHQKGFASVRIIHGKGIGVQREIVRKVLANSEYVAKFHDGGPTAGGWGATIAWLKY